jgi:hypothetical protein
LESDYGMSSSMKKLLWISAVILIGALVLNNILGGFQDVESNIVEVNGYKIYGQAFSGKYDSDQLSDIVTHSRELLADKKLHGDLVIVNYFDFKAEKRGVVNQFIGIQLSESEEYESIAGYELRTIEAKRVIESVIGVRKLVMPSPEKIKQKANELARDNGMELMDLSIETYKNNHLIIHIPIR